MAKKPFYKELAVKVEELENESNSDDSRLEPNWRLNIEWEKRMNVEHRTSSGKR